MLIPRVTVFFWSPKAAIYARQLQPELPRYQLGVLDYDGNNLVPVDPRDLPG
jgi:hypothetical protein